MVEWKTLEKMEANLKQANCYGEYNYCFTAQPEDTIGDVILMCFGAIGGAIAAAIRKKGATGYILNKNEKGIGIIPVEKIGKEEELVPEKTIFLKNEDIDQVRIKNDTMGKCIKIKMKDNSKYGFKTARKIKNVDYHETNLKKFMESYR